MDFETSNLNFAAACVSYGATVRDTKDLGKGKILFLMENCPKSVFIFIYGEVEGRDIINFTQLLHLFTSNCLMLKPNYPSSIKSLKTLIYDRKNNG